MNVFKKLWFKVKADNPAEYKFLKHTERYIDKLRKINPPDLDFPTHRGIHFKHSGNAGDVIYAIPAMKAIANNQDIHLHLLLNRNGEYPKHFKHPSGSVMLNKKMFEMLQPLILSQPAFKECTILEHQQVDVDLDIIREYPLLLDRGNISRWYFLIFPGNFDLNEPWLQVEPSNDVYDGILLARSSRYQAPNIDYSILKKYPKVYFIGTPDEFADMKKIIPSLVYRPVKNFLEMTSLIAGSRLFIGNQSLPFSLAEALKINRLLEVYFECPNVTVYGNKGFDFSFQPQFEKLVKLRYENNGK